MKISSTHPHFMNAYQSSLLSLECAEPSYQDMIREMQKWVRAHQSYNSALTEKQKLVDTNYLKMMGAIKAVSDYINIAFKDDKRGDLKRILDYFE